MSRDNQSICLQIATRISVRLSRSTRQGKGPFPNVPSCKTYTQHRTYISFNLFLAFWDIKYFHNISNDIGYEFWSFTLIIFCIARRFLAFSPHHSQYRRERENSFLLSSHSQFLCFLDIVDLFHILPSALLFLSIPPPSVVPLLLTA